MNRFFLTLLFVAFISLTSFAQNKPLRVSVAGLTHTHVHWILGREKHDDIEIVGIAEPNRELAERFAKEHGFSMSIVYNTLEEMIAATKPQAITAFGTIYEHLKVVEIAAPKGIHVMVEKPLAVSVDHAKKMAALARKYNIYLLTNYETTWYPTNHKAQELLKNNSIGALTQVVVRDGHRGPKRIGINKEFLDWLTDPVQNGGGAVVDFGCYGANLSTWLHDGKKPLSVTAITQQFQPENNPKVDDEATIILTYPKSKATIQASWNWPIGRKDMEVYGTTGVIYADNRNSLRVRMAEGYDGFKEESMQLPERATPYNDPFSLLAAVVNGEIKLNANDLSSLENNLIVVEILEAAKESARTGKTVKLSQ
jgi:predicted dehydrogenase